MEHGVKFEIYILKNHPSWYTFSTHTQDLVISLWHCCFTLQRISKISCTKNYNAHVVIVLLTEPFCLATFSLLLPCGFINSLISIPNYNIQAHLFLYFSYSSSCCSSHYLTKDVHFVSLASYIQHCPPNFKLRFPFEFSNDVCSYIFISKQTWEGEITHVKSDQIKRSFPNDLVSVFLNECLCTIFDLKWVWIT